MFANLLIISPTIMTKTEAFIKKAVSKAEEKFDAMLIRYDAWITVLLAVLLVLAFTIASALAIYCVTKGLKFSGSWKWSIRGVSVKAECI